VKYLICLALQEDGDVTLTLCISIFQKCQSICQELC